MPQSVYKTEKINDHITKISESFIVNCYLIEGTERAILLDCGTGVGNINEFVKTLTDKPFSLVATHAHVDHIGGVRNFNKMYINAVDIPIILWSTSNFIRSGYLREHPGAKHFDFDYTKIKKSHKPFLVIPFCDGHIFDLGGGVKVKAYRVPGHTRGSCFFKMKNEDIIFTGDTFIQFLHLCYHYPASLLTWTKDYELLKKVGSGCTLYPSHGRHAVPWEALEWQYKKAKEIIASTEKNSSVFKKEKIKVTNPDHPHLSIFYRSEYVYPFLKRNR